MGCQVLLVDDEAVDLEWLKRRVLASGLAIDVAGTAKSGFQALELMAQRPVDIILSDIRMPIMTGTEFARQAKAINPKAKIIFISGHEDFGYAKEAIAISASAYLLKPVEDGELIRLLESVCREVEAERAKEQAYSKVLSLVHEELLLRWLQTESPPPVEPHLQAVLEPILQGGTAAALVEIDDLAWKQRELPPDERAAQMNAAAAAVKACAGQAKLGTVLTAGPRRFAVLAAVSEAAFAAMLDELVERVRRQTPFTVTIGAGRRAEDAAALHESYREAEAALSAKWLLGKDRVIRGESSASPSAVPSARLDDAAERLLQAIADYDLVAIDDRLRELFMGDEPAARRQDVYERIVRVTSKLHAGLQQRSEDLYELLEWESRRPDVLFEFETIHDIVSWLRRRFFELSELLYMKRQKQKRKLIDAVMAYVDAHIEGRITLKDVAAHFDFTPNYLGHLFKEETGRHFSDYVTERRIARVCEMLKEPTLRIYEIADRMGYKNIIYFNRQFKQAVGMSPGEYRKANRI